MTAKMKLYNNKYLRRFDNQQMARLSTSKVNRARRLKAGKVKRSSGKVKRSSGAKRKSSRVSPTITTMAVDPMYYAPPPMEDDDMSSSPLTMIILFMMLAGCVVAWYFVITEMKETPAATTVSAAAGLLQAKYIRAALASILTLITLVMMFKTFM